MVMIGPKRYGCSFRWEDHDDVGVIHNSNVRLWLVANVWGILFGVLVVDVVVLVLLLSVYKTFRFDITLWVPKTAVESTAFIP